MTGRSPQRSLFRTAVADPGGPALGIWLKIPAMEIIELVAQADFDFVVIDLEHSPLSLESAYRIIGTALPQGVSPLVRVPGLDAGVVKRVLDAGAEGIVVPHVDTAEQAAAAVGAARFPPLGARGVGSTSRAGGWGASSREDYLHFGNEQVVVIAQIESAVGVRNAGAIAATAGVDALLVGPADLSVSVGRAETDPTVVALIGQAVAAARAAGIPVGNAGAATVESVRSSVDRGFTFTLLSNDAGLFGAAARAAVAAGRSVTFG